MLVTIETASKRVTTTAYVIFNCAYGVRFVQFRATKCLSSNVLESKVVARHYNRLHSTTNLDRLAFLLRSMVHM